MRRPVPEIPHEIIGPCVYGHILTEEHKAHFKLQRPDVPDWKISEFFSLVSVASSGYHTAHTAEVHDAKGERQVCLILVGYKDRRRFNDWRWEDGFMTDMENLLGITGEPDWYPCRRRSR